MNTHGLVVARLMSVGASGDPKKIVILNKCSYHEFKLYSVSKSKIQWYMRHTKYGETMMLHTIMQLLIITL
jgi:hypothetical protein